MNHPLQQAEAAVAAGIESAEVALVRIVRNSAFNVVGTALIVPFNFVALFTLARRLGAESLGTFFTIFAISAVIHWIADAGISTVLTRKVAREIGDLRNIVGEATGMLLLVRLSSATMFFSVSIPWMALALGQVSVPLLFLAAAAMASRHSLDFAANVFRGLERFEFENLSRVIQCCLFCLFVWLGVYPSTGGTIAAFVAFMASNAIAAVVIWAILIVGWKCGSFRLNREIAFAWYRESVPLGVGDVIRQLLLQLDTLLLSAFRPAAIVGLFGVAARPLQPLQLLPRTIVSVTFPMMSRAAHVDRAALSATFANTTNLLWIASLPVSIIVSVCARPMILATAGLGFVDATLPLQLLIWTTPLIFINAQLRFVMTALDAERRYRQLIVWVLVSKIVSEVLLILAFGLYGACWGNLLGEGVLCVAGLVILRGYGVVGPSWVQFVRAVPAAMGMAAVLMALVYEDAGIIGMALGGAVSFAVYLVLCLLFGAWAWSDFMRIWQIVRKRATYSGGGVVAPARAAVAAEAEVAMS